jgi:hypothetical protein
MAKTKTEYKMEFSAALTETVDQWWKSHHKIVDEFAMPANIATIIQFLENIYDLSFKYSTGEWVGKRREKTDEIKYTR